MHHPSNNALHYNPPNAYYHLSQHGSDWLWAVTALYAVALFAWMGWTFKARHGEKIFHYILIVAAFTGTVAYFTMASDLGSTPIATQLNNHGNDGLTRQIWYARYINWFVGWAALIIANMLATGVSWGTIFFTVAVQWVWVVCWLCGALVHSRYKWGYYTFGLVAYFVVAYQLGFVGTRFARQFGPMGTHSGATYGLIFLWMLYAIAWGLDEGGNKISVTHGQVFYGILDLLTVPLWGFAYLHFTSRFDHDALALNYTNAGRHGIRGGHSNGFGHRGVKNGHTTGTTTAAV